MNIFAVHPGPRTAARMLCDKHIVQMGREAVENLSAAHRVLDGSRQKVIHWNTGKPAWAWVLDDDREPYLLSVRTGMAANHHCVWARHNSGNYGWLAAHAVEIFAEYTRRYGRVHAYSGRAAWLHDNLPYGLSDGPRTHFCQGVSPDCYQPPEHGVFAHRLNYVRYKSIFAVWRHGRPPPDWYTTLCATEAPRHRGLSKWVLRREWTEEDWKLRPSPLA